MKKTNITSYLNNSIKTYLEELAARKNVPGGGSASALTAAIAAALNLMVINYSYGGTGLVCEKKIAIKEHQQKSLKRLSMLVDEDCMVFSKLIKVVSLKKKAEKEYIASSLVPMEICRECLVSMKVTLFLSASYNKHFKSDVECAMYILKAAFLSARSNVEINLEKIKDNAFVSDTEKKLRKMTKKMEQMSEHISSKLNPKG